jgi:integrase
MPRYYIPKEDFAIIKVGEIEPYLDMAPDEDSRMFIATCWLTGSRINEIAKLERKNIKINPDNRDLEFTIKAQKFGKVGFPGFSFDDPFVRMLIPFYEKRKEGRVFQRGKRRYQQIILELNKSIHGSDTTKYLTFHQFRHSRISYLARELRASPEELKSWTGHRASSFEDYFAPRKIDRFKGKMQA